MNWRMGVRSGRPSLRSNCAITGLFLVILAAALPLAGREKDKLPYGEGLIVNIPLPESEVEEVVREVAQNGVIRGTKEYNKDEFISGAKAASSTRVFPAWDQGGKVFYKVREQALDPRNFKDSSDVGTLVVRYVVLAQGDKNSVLRIDALFQEDYRHNIHQSSGSVESAEYKDIQEHLEAIEVMKQQTVEAESERQEQLLRKKNQATQTYAPTEAEPQAVPQAMPSQSQGATQGPPQTSNSLGAADQTGSRQGMSESSPEQALPAQTEPARSLEEHVKDLRKQLERLVKSPGAPLKSAPFHTASTLVLLNPGAEVLIVISTPYWYGVETHDGQHGWMMRDQLEVP